MFASVTALIPDALAFAIACGGALQYAGLVHALWLRPQPPRTLLLGFQQFWFDVTKSDWRDTMVMNVPREMLRDHAAMYWFDLRQQFGIAVHEGEVKSLLSSLARFLPGEVAEGD